MVSFILLCVFLAFVAFSAFVGFVRGMNKSIIRLITLAFAMVLTFFASALATNLIAEKLLIEGQTLGEMVLGMVSSEEMIANFLASAPLLEKAILVAPSFAIAIVIFPVMFLVLSFISWIVFRCIQKPLRRKMFKETFPKNRAEKKEMKKNKKPFLVRFGKRCAGLGIGAVTGALIFGMLFAPIFGIISILPENSALVDVIDTMVEQEILDASTAQTIKDELAVRDGAIIKGYGYVGTALAGKLYLSAVSRFEHDGLKTNIPAEFDSVFSVAQVAIEGGLLKAIMNSDDMNGIFTVLSNEEFVNELISEMFKSQIFCAAIPEVMAIAMESVALSLNVPADKNAVYNNMMDDIASSVKDADVDYEGIKAYEAAQVATDYVALDEAQTIMTKEEYEAEIQKLADLTLKISKIINTAVSGSSEAVANTLAGQIVEDIKAEIMVNGEDVLTGFNSESVKTTLSDISSGNTDASAQSVLEKMTDSDKFETNVATVETITNSIRESVKSAVADTDKAQETASTLASVVCDFASAVESATDENGNMDVANLDFNKIANAVTSLQNSNLKDVGSSVLDLVVSGDFGEGSELIGNAVGAIKDSYNNGEDIGGTINSAGALIIIGSSMGTDGGSKENVANSFKDLVQNLNETTLNLLSTILSEESLISMGVERAYAEIAYDVVDALLRELMELKNSANYDNEVNTVLSIYDILSAGDMKEEQIGDLFRQVLKSQVVMNTLDRVSTDILSAELLVSLKVPQEYAQEICTAVAACVDEMLTLRNTDTAAYNAEIDALVATFMSLEDKDMSKDENLADLFRQIFDSKVVMNMLNKVASDVLTADLLTAIDVPEKYAEAVCTVIETLVSELTALGSDDSYTYDNEVNAILAVKNLVNKNGKFENADIKPLVDSAKNSEAIYNTLMKISDSVTIEIAETDRDEIIKGIETFYAESDKTEKDRNIFNAVADIFGVTVNLK